MWLGWRDTSNTTLALRSRTITSKDVEYQRWSPPLKILLLLGFQSSLVSLTGLSAHETHRLVGRAWSSIQGLSQTQLTPSSMNEMIIRRFGTWHVRSSTCTHQLITAIMLARRPRHLSITTWLRPLGRTSCTMLCIRLGKWQIRSGSFTD
jgi:hypothetical protein